MAEDNRDKVAAWLAAGTLGEGVCDAGIGPGRTGSKLMGSGGLAMDPDPGKGSIRMACTKKVRIFHALKCVAE